MNKRTFIKTGFILSAGSLLAPAVGSKKVFGSVLSNMQASEFTQVPLGFAFNALEPYIDAQTMELHYTKHHAGYTSKFNAAVKNEGLSGKSIKDIFAETSKHSASIRNNGGGYFNHNLFWQGLSPTGGGKPKSRLLNAINKDFGSFENFKTEFSGKAGSVFGSGWAWLIKKDGKLKITSSPNQDNPLMDIAEEKGTPLLCLDVWEHAYYLHYQNRRAEYIAAFWNIVNWNFVEKNLT